ncbi:MAG: diguanylate cyclase [Candidatus Omnitrophota bacterium]
MKTTLQARVMLVVAVFSLFLISVFTFVQIHNQARQERDRAVYQARQDALIVKNELEALRGDGGVIPDRARILEKARETFGDIINTGVIGHASLIEPDGSPVVLEGDLSLFSEDDAKSIEKIVSDSDGERWLFPDTDNTRKLVHLYVKFSNEHGYIAKLSFSLRSVQAALNRVYMPVLLTVMAVLLGAAALAAALSFVVIYPIKELNEATKKVAGGDLDIRVSLKTGDELQDLSETFNIMTSSLQDMKMKAENANPLTKLPGNIIIREEVEKRIASGEKFALIYADLDNFKAFNDKYGVSAGDKAISMTADILREAVAREADPGDFVGHEGGDDFLILTTPERAEAVVSRIVKEFDGKIEKLYKKEDIDRGYIEKKSREGEHLVKYPIMAISLAGVSNREQCVSSYADLTNIAAEVKSKVKARRTDGPGGTRSAFLINRRYADLGPEHRKAGRQNGKEEVGT